MSTSLAFFYMDNTSRIDDIFEIVTFIKDNAIARDEFDELKREVLKIQTTMVTKDYLDEKTR
jgi:hypothetical protein